jgi:putative transposase
MPPSAWDEEEHVKRLHQLGHRSPASLTRFARRGVTLQQPRRRCEQTLRSSIVLLADWTADLGWTLPQTAELLALSARTLRQWHHDLHHTRWQIHLLGRPVRRASVAERNDVIALLHELGPATGVPTLCTCFPTMPRVELADIVRRYRLHWRRRHRQLLHTLRWTMPGAIWAMDFAQAPAPVDNLHPYLLAVRDLASSQQLLWLPVPTPTADAAIAALHALFACHGAPLVLKTDNGSAFCAEATLDLLREKEVLPLFSPPRTPRYNGAAEAGIGSLKTRTETHATRQGRPGHWTWDDVAQAQLEANATARPHGPTGPTPEQAWRQRPTISAQQRQLFHAAVSRRRIEARAEARTDARAARDLPTDGPLPTLDQRLIDRRAIRRALVEHGYLVFRRRRIPPPIRPPKTAKIR